MIWKLFSSLDLLPHGFCYQRKPALIWLHAIADSMIALSYFLIPVALIYFVRRRRDIPFPWMFVSFGIFIGACGATHVMDVWTLWVPSYWFSGAVKIITALASVPTALFLVHLMPSVLSLPSHEEMKNTNRELNRQASVLKKTEERFRQMADNIQEIFWILDPQTKEVSYLSPAFEQICELPLDSLHSNPASYRELIHHEDRQRVLAQLERLESTHQLDEEFRIVCPSGTVKWIRALGFTAKDSTGYVTTLVGTAQEITARKEMEAVLRESEDRYRDLVEHSTDLICTHNLEGRLLSVNELPIKLLGYTRDEMLNKPMRDFLLPETRAQFDQYLLDIQRDGFAQGLMVVITKTGERRIWDYHNTLRTDGVAAPIVRGIAHDVTYQKRAEKALRLSEEKFSKAFRSSPVEITITTFEEGRFLEVNESFERNNGFTRSEVIGHASVELGLWHKAEDRAVVIEQIKKHGRLQDYEVCLRSKCGMPRVKRYSAEQIVIAGQLCLLAVCTDITLQKKIAEALRRSEEKFSKAFRSSPSMIWISTLEHGILTEVNESFEKHTGYLRNELLGHSAHEIGLWIDLGEEEALRRDIQKYGYARDREIRVRAKSGQMVVIQISVELIELCGEKCLLAVGQNITERKRAEEELRYLSGRLLRSQDEERRRIARDLHDSTGQNLVALATMLSQLHASIPSDQHRSRRLLSESKALADKCLSEVRTLSYTLYPPVLDEAGLEHAIRDYVKGFTRRSGVQVTLEISSLTGRMIQDVELTLFRVVQESLTNIHRHSGSQLAKIRIDRNSDLVLEISDVDKGPSFPASANGELRPEAGVGIRSMQERVKLIGGHLDIDLSDHGSTVRVTIPRGGEPR